LLIVIKFSLRRLEFNARSVHVGFVTYKVTLERDGEMGTEYGTHVSKEKLFQNFGGKVRRKEGTSNTPS